MNVIPEQEKSTQVIATPKLGIVKGVVIILLGIVLGVFFYLSYFFDKNVGGIFWGLALFGLCSWKGVATVIRRNKNHVSYLNLGIWSFLFIGALVFAIWATSVNVQWAIIHGR